MTPSPLSSFLPGTGPVPSGCAGGRTSCQNLHLGTLDPMVVVAGLLAETLILKFRGMLANSC